MYQLPFHTPAGQSGEWQKLAAVVTAFHEQHGKWPSHYIAPNTEYLLEHTPEPYRSVMTSRIIMEMIDDPVIIASGDPEIVDLASIPLKKFDASPGAEWLWTLEAESDEATEQVA